MGKTILVTGGGGFIGSHVNQLLQDKGYSTIVLDDLSSGNRQAVLQGTFIEGNVSDKQLLNEIFEKVKITAVMHFAAYTDVGESVQNPEKYYKNNVCSTLHLLEAMRKNDVKTFIFSSSAAVYGIPANRKIKETDPCSPINPYGHSKLMVETILHNYYEAYHFSFSSLRYFNAAGGDPWGRIKYFSKPKENNLIPIVLDCLMASSPLTVNGTDYPTKDGTCIRDYVHVTDLAEAHILAMEKLFKEGGRNCYNLGNGQGFSIYEVLEAAEKVTGINLKKIEGKRRAGDPPILLADATKAQSDLNWFPQFPNLETIIEHAWKAREHRG